MKMSNIIDRILIIWNALVIGLINVITIKEYLEILLILFSIALTLINIFIKVKRIYKNENSQSYTSKEFID